MAVPRAWSLVTAIFVRGVAWRRPVVWVHSRFLNMKIRRVLVVDVE